MKTTQKRILFFVILTILILLPSFFTKKVKGNVLLSKDPSNYQNYGVTTNDDQLNMIDGSYSFNAKFLRDSNGNAITTTQLSSKFSTNSVTAEYNNSVNHYIELSTDSPDYAIGEYILYKNVGKYNGKTVDFKITITGYEFAGKYASVYFPTDRIGAFFWGLDSINYKFEFFEHGTNNKIDVKGYFIYADIDEEQAVHVNKEDVDAYCVTKDTALILYKGSDDGPVFQTKAYLAVNNDDIEKDYHLMILYNKSELNMTYYASQGFSAPKTKNVVNTYKAHKNAVLHGPIQVWFATSYYKMSRSNIAEPIKFVSDIDELLITENTIGNTSENITYDIFFTVPQENQEYFYDSLILTDTIPNCLNVSSVKVFNDSNENVSNLFTITANNNLSIVAKNTQTQNFYNKTYQVKVSCTVNNNYTNFKTSNNHYLWRNTAKINITRTAFNDNLNKNSNTVTSNYYTKNLTINKIWKDNSNAQNLRPSSININVYQGNNLYLIETLNASNSTGVNNWVKTIELPKYTSQGIELIYSITENPIELSNGERYVPTINGTTITNTLTKDTSIDITKIWLDDENKYLTRPENLNITILQNGSNFKTITLNTNNSINLTTWKSTRIIVPKYDSNGIPYIYTIQEDENNRNLIYYYQEPIYDQDNLTVTNTAVWLPVNPDDLPEYMIIVNKEIINNNNQVATQQDYEKIKLNINTPYQFPIILKELNKTLSAGPTSMLESYSGYSGNEYHGLVTKDKQLIFRNIPAGKYEISENIIQYFDFVNIEKINASTGASFSIENGKYYLTLSGITANSENIEVLVTNKIEPDRPYDDSSNKNNLFSLDLLLPEN